MFASTRKSRKWAWTLFSVMVILSLLASFATAAPTYAQVAVVSPEVGPDGWVTFRYLDATADRVQLYGEWGRNELGAFCYGPNGWPLVEMTKDADGVWSYTVQLEPNLYNYHFNVFHGEDVVSVADPANAPWHPVAINSQVWVPGEAVSWVGPQDVPHGTLEEVTYYSSYTGGERPLAVYTPPDYGKNNRTYPTLYLSHGFWGNHVDWSTQGAANNILDNLIAAKMIRPMVVVMTNFNGLGGGEFDPFAGWNEYRADLIGSVVPAVEDMYRVNRNPEQRAFAGLSAGAFRASNILLNDAEEFGFIGIWSGAFIPADDPGLMNPELYDMRGIHIAIGGQDFLYGMSMDGMAVLDANNVPYESLITPGDCHTWYFWRDSLYDFLTSMAFKVN